MEEIRDLIQSWLKESDYSSVLFGKNEKIRENRQNRINSYKSRDQNTNTILESFFEELSQSINIYPFQTADNFIEFASSREDSLIHRYIAFYFVADCFTLNDSIEKDELYEFGALILLSNDQMRFIEGCIELDSMNISENTVSNLNFKSMNSNLFFLIIHNFQLAEFPEYSLHMYHILNPKPKTIKDNKILIDTLVANSKIYDAFKIVRQAKFPESDEDDPELDIFQYFTDQAAKYGKIKEFCTLPFSQDEEDLIISSIEFPGESNYKHFCYERHRFDSINE